MTSDLRPLEDGKVSGEDTLPPLYQNGVFGLRLGGDDRHPHSETRNDSR